MQLARSPEDDEFAVAESSGAVQVYAMSSERAVQGLSAGGAPVTDADWSATGRLVVAVGGQLAVLDPARSALPTATHPLNDHAAALVK